MIPTLQLGQAGRSILAGEATTDPYFSNVVLLLHADGSGTSYVDDSPSNHTNFNSTVSQSTAQFKFGTASFDLPSAIGAASLEVQDIVADWQFGSGQFTVECFIRYSTIPTGSNIRVIASNYNGSSDLGWAFRMNNGNLVFYYSTTGTNSITSVSGAWSPVVDTWYHVAADCDSGGTIRTYADGSVIGSAARSAAIFASTQRLYIGNDGGGVRKSVAFIDEVRITKGVARYGGAFSPPSEAFPNS